MRVRTDLRSGTHPGVDVAKRTEDERKRGAGAAETVAWALKRGELNGMRRAFKIVSLQYDREYIAEAIAKLEAELGEDKS